MGEREKAPSSKRRWWIAGLLNFLGGFGVGYLYVGRPIRALIAVVNAILALAILWYGLNGWLAEPWVAVAVVWLYLLLSLAFVVDAMLVARRSDGFAPRWYNRWWVYAAVIVVAHTYGSLWTKRSVQTFYLPSGSMAPTLRIGDYVIVDKRAFDSRDPARGDVVVFRLPRDAKKHFIKRIVGLPGDEVQVKDGVLYINRTAVPTTEEGTYALDWGDGSPTSQVDMKREVIADGREVVVLDSTSTGDADNTEVFKVPAGHYFVLGDNRDNSIDSRYASVRRGVGYVPHANMVGVVSWIFWSPDWARIGLRVQ